ncbi:hypothetical protein FNF29_05270 [Cafeteria roenbergensis]|uniref:Uncharacterized protein n=1 Tax=Cafeteria roenbergensis TaxID=33653 RepID=A0A5A8CCW8_CAFRO|nr:hypothetical protein FNF29_05270 [Cafeteria roenbergensis]|eukprot:KAA0150467.1 hypothetical protein FNF29_05270 [Cafeteria roenbergensis]
MQDAIASGFLGAAAAVMGKSGVDSGVTSGWGSTVCGFVGFHEDSSALDVGAPSTVLESIAAHLAMLSTCSGLTTALIRVAFLGLMLAINGAKLGFMVRGMAALGATVFVAIDLVAGTITEAIADAALFGHRPSLRWTTGAALMTAGVFVVAMEQARAQRAADARAAAVAGASAEAPAVAGAEAAGPAGAAAEAGAEAAGPAGAAPVAGEYDAPGTPHSVPAAASDSDGDDVGTSANRRSSSGPFTRRRARRAD